MHGTHIHTRQTRYKNTGSSENVFTTPSQRLAIAKALCIEPDRTEEGNESFKCALGAGAPFPDAPFEAVLQASIGTIRKDILPRYV